MRDLGSLDSVEPREVIELIPMPFDEALFNEAVEWIESNDPTPDEIRAYAAERRR